MKIVFTSKPVKVSTPKWSGVIAPYITEQGEVGTLMLSPLEYEKYSVIDSRVLAEKVLAEFFNSSEVETTEVQFNQRGRLVALD